MDQPLRFYIGPKTHANGYKENLDGCWDFALFKQYEGESEYNICKDYYYSVYQLVEGYIEGWTQTGVFPSELEGYSVLVD
jgi:hypothetical protein